MKIKLNVAVDNYGEKGEEVDVPTFLAEAWANNGTAEIVEEKKVAKKEEAKEEAEEVEVKKPSRKKGAEEVETAEAADDIEAR